MNIKLIFAIESSSAEGAIRMALESALVNGSGIVIAFLHMAVQFLVCKQLVFVCKDFLVSRTQVADLLVVDCFHMAMQVRPAQTSNIAISVRTIVSQEQDCIFHDLSLLVSDAIVRVCARNICVCKVFVSFCGVVRKYDKVRWSLLRLDPSRKKERNRAG